MDVRELRYKALRSETLTNIWYTDTEGFLMPKGAPYFSSIDALNPKYWGWTADVAGTASVRIGGQWLGGQVDSFFVGNGVATTFSPITFAGTPLQVGYTSLWTVIGATRYAWHDSDGIEETFTGIVHSVGTGAAGPYGFTAKAIALKTGSVTVNWTSGGAHSVVDNGAGVFADAKIAASAINYLTGVISITFAAGFEPDLGTVISLDGTTDTTFDVFFRERLGIGDGTTDTFVSAALNKNLRPGSSLFSYVILGVTYYAEDDGAGNIVDLLGAHVAGGSTVNYTTGAVTLSLTSSPDQNTNIDMVYNKAGLIASAINYATGQLSVTFAAGLPPDNLQKIFALSSWRDHTDFAGIDVVTGILLMNQPGKRIHLRDARGYLDVGSEGYDGSVYAHYCKPFDIFSLAAYIRRYNGAETGYLRIRFWDGTSAYNQVSIGATEWENYSKFSGNFSRVADPYAPAFSILQFSVTETTKHDKLTVAFQVPPGARAFSIEFETDAAGVQEGDQIFSMSGLYLSQGTTAFSYSPPAEIKYLPRPPADGSIGKILAWNEYGRTQWVDPSLLGVAAIATLNGLSASIQSLAIGVAGNSPAWSSVVNTHTLNLPLASVAGVTAGLVAYADWANWQATSVGTFAQAANPNTFTRELIPSVDNSVDLGTAVKRWQDIYAVNLFASTLVRIGSAVNYGQWSIVGTDLVVGRAGAVVNFNLTAFTSVIVGAVTGATLQANRLYALGSSDVVHLEVVGNVLQTTNLFNIQNSGGSAYLRGSNSLALTLLGSWDITNNAAGTIPMRIRGAVGQTANLFAVQNSGGTDLVWSTSAGILGLANHAGVLGSGLFYIPKAASTGLLSPTSAGYGEALAPTWTPLSANTFIFLSVGFNWMRMDGAVHINGQVDLQTTSSMSLLQIRLDTAFAGIAVDSYTKVRGHGLAFNTGSPISFPVSLAISAGRIMLEVIDPMGAANLDTGLYTVIFSAICFD